MGNLEHNIKEAFAAQDSKTKLGNKNNMWDRLDGQIHGRRGVAAFWRVAAILLGFVLFTGAFAALRVRAKHQTVLKEMEMKSADLAATIDSLLLLPVSTESEVQIVERVKLVYRDKPVADQSFNSAKYWEKKYESLADSTEMVLATKKKQDQQFAFLNQELAKTKTELATVQRGLKTESRQNQTAPFELKTERIELEVAKTPSVKNQEMEMKVFQRNFIENKNNLNSTIFKK